MHQQTYMRMIGNRLICELPGHHQVLPETIGELERLQRELNLLKDVVSALEARVSLLEGQQLLGEQPQMLNEGSLVVQNGNAADDSFTTTASIHSDISDASYPNGI